MSIPGGGGPGRGRFTVWIPRKWSHNSHIPRKWSYISQIPHKWSHISHIPRKWSHISQIPRKWSHISQIPRKWSHISHIPRKWSYISQIFRNWSETTSRFPQVRSLQVPAAWSQTSSSQITLQRRVVWPCTKSAFHVGIRLRAKNRGDTFEFKYRK